MISVRSRSCHHLISLRRSPRPIGLTLWTTSSRDIQGGLLVPTTAVSCLPAWRSSRQRTGTSAINTNVADQIVRGNASVQEKLARAFRSLVRALQVLLRAVRIGLLFSPVVVSGSVVGLIQRLGVLPEALSTTLCDWWWGVFLKVVDQSGPTFIKVSKHISRTVYPELMHTRVRCNTYSSTLHQNCAKHTPGTSLANGSYLLRSRAVFVLSSTTIKLFPPTCESVRAAGDAGLFAQDIYRA